VASEFICPGFEVIILPNNPETLLMQTRKPINIPVVSSTAQESAMASSSCSGSETFALSVLGDSMVPEFIEGELLVIEPDVPAVDGSYVIGWANEELIFRQLKRDAQGGWRLHALNPAYPEIALSGLDAIRGVVTQKKKPGSRKSVKYYVAH
jgi:SOS-response transcriptional repressor LexA